MAFGTIRNVRKVFSASELNSRSAEPVIALDDANFEFDEGQLIALLGPSGCGKTTLLRIVAGLIQKTSGSVTIGGREITEPLGDYGFVFQSPSLMPWRNVLENVLFPVDMRGAVGSDARARAERLLQMVDLWTFRDKRPRELSGGMRQRVALARALINDPRILLMDEPFSALDAITRDEMGLALARIWDTEPKTAIFITHSIREAIFLSDRILVMGRRPSTIVEDLRVPFKRPRDPSVEAEPEFNDLYLYLKNSIHRTTPSVQ